MTSEPTADQAQLLAAAKEDHDTVLELTRALVRIPSRAGVDPYQPSIRALSGWMTEHGLPITELRDDSGATVGLTSEIRGARPGPRWVLDACLDTAPFGDELAWTHPPTSGLIHDGWLWGRGSADSKAAVAIFCHLAVRLAAVAEQLHGSLVLLFDLDEHTGGFAGAKRYFQDRNTDVAGVMIGYPGLDKLVTGGRGVYRIELRVHGTAAHSGASKPSPNAIEKAADLIHELRTRELPKVTDPLFPLPGKLTVTAITGGQGYTTVPDLCTVNLDVRTTPHFDETAAQTLIHTATARIDHRWPQTRATDTRVVTRWPAYALPANSPLRATLLSTATAFGVDIEPKIAGPANIGNYLAGLGVPATAGFGVAYTGLHATDERIRIDTIPLVQAVYHATVLRLLSERLEPNE